MLDIPALAVKLLGLKSEFGLTVAGPTSVFLSDPRARKLASGTGELVPREGSSWNRSTLEANPKIGSSSTLSGLSENGKSSVTKYTIAFLAAGG